MNLGRVTGAFALVLLSTYLWAASLSADQETAKIRGVTLYNQFKDGEPDLRIAAEAGDRDAQYYLAQDLKNTARYMTAEAMRWYTAAAEQGDMYAMYQLAFNGGDLCNVMRNCPQGSRSADEWGDILLGAAKSLAAQGDGEALYMMYMTTDDLGWLEKSATAGFAFSQYLLAMKYTTGKAFFFPPWKRADRINELYKQSAEGGYPPAMLEYADMLRESGRIAEGVYWLERGANSGHALMMGDYAYAFSNEDNRWKIPVDYIKGYGLMLLLTELDGGGTTGGFAKKELPKIANHMTPEQIEEAKKFAAQWKATHPPLSYFPQKIGF